MKRASRIAIFCLALLWALSGTAFGCKGGSGGATTVLNLPLSGSPTPTITPAPTPTPAPPPVLAFTENEENRLPALPLRLPLGGAYALAGEVTANYPLTCVTAAFTCYRNYGTDYPKTFSVHFRAADGIYTYDLTQGNTIEGRSLALVTDFSSLTVGLHTLTISAKSSMSVQEQVLFSTDFYVLGDTWKRFSKDEFNGTYGSTSRFFGGRTERFLYPFQMVYDRYAIADPDWESEYIVSLPAYGGRDWLIHIDALPYYEKALAYIAATRVRVHGTNGDTGVLPLADCIVTYNGSYVPRYTSSLKTASHHAFGTATDLNAKLAPNENRKENNALIDEEVRDLLTYNGILTASDGGKYYDFTYAGAYQTTAFQMPETVINYLLYELAFYRAGFQWGHYYVSTSDAMHFSLTDSIQMDHSSRRGLRKVREYADASDQTAGG